MVGFLERLLRGLFALPPQAAFIAVLPGLALGVAGLIIGVSFFTYSIDAGAAKQVGFVWAPNWFLALSLVLPAGLFLILRMAQEAEDSLGRLIDKKMLARCDGARWTLLTRAELDGVTAGYWRISQRLGVLVIALMVLYSVGEWVAVAGWPLFDCRAPGMECKFLPGPGASDWFYEKDWSVAALLPGSQVRWVANAVFGLLAYGVAALYAGLIFAAFIFASVYSLMMYGFSRGRNGVQIVPSIDDDDRRRGFGLFENFFRYALYVTLCGVVVAYFIHVQNMFLRSADGNIIAFISDGISAGFRAVFQSGGIGGLVDVIFATGVIYENLNSVIAVVAVIAGLFLVLFCVALTLNDVAKKSRERFEDYIVERNGDFSDFTGLAGRAAVRARLAHDEMVTWPLGWLKINELILYAAFAFLCVIFYKLGLIFVGALAARIAIKALARFTGLGAS